MKNTLENTAISAFKMHSMLLKYKNIKNNLSNIRLAREWTITSLSTYNNIFEDFAIIDIYNKSRSLRMYSVGIRIALLFIICIMNK